MDSYLHYEGIGHAPADVNLCATTSVRTCAPISVRTFVFEPLWHMLGHVQMHGHACFFADDELFQAYLGTMGHYTLSVLRAWMQHQEVVRLEKEMWACVMHCRRNDDGAA